VPGLDTQPRCPIGGAQELQQIGQGQGDAALCVGIVRLGHVQDTDFREHTRTWHAFTRLITGMAGLAALILVVMAATLL